MKPRRVRILAGKLDRGTGARVYNRELALRLAARGHEVSVVCVEAIKEVTEHQEYGRSDFRASGPRQLVWRFEHRRLYGHCARELRRLELYPTDVVIAANDYFMKIHYSMFPQTPWVYLPHAMIATATSRVRECHGRCTWPRPVCMPSSTVGMNQANRI